jgi:hypothetical protein
MASDRGTGITFEGDTMIANLKEFDLHVARATAAAAEYIAPQAEAHMKNNAPWTDRTGAARNGLRAKVVAGPETIGIVLYHSVPYGIFLEVRFNGAYAIILPTIQEFAPRFLDAIGRLVFDGGA